MDELTQSWQAVQTPVSTREEIGQMVDRRLKKHMSAARRTLRYDMAGALIIVLVFISMAFVMDLNYRWMVFALLIVFTLLLYVHYQIKYRVFHPDQFNKLSLTGVVKYQIKSIRRYRNMYYTGIPLFAMILMGTYNLRYTDLDYWLIAVITCTTGILVHMLVRLIWQWLYADYSRRMESLGRINHLLTAYEAERA